ncbi:hypothetical protein C7460_1491, partial [Marinoscillum furvescens DSM 4134]
CLKLPLDSQLLRTPLPSANDSTPSGLVRDLVKKKLNLTLEVEESVHGTPKKAS